ncbi:hypothetical protein DRQ25_00300 [Candidatus Fermentibacteria bacterium]|nr:MAG: hypothetical protein DRQ25_00300 [Candidatus Fermentibacteria bacterium]
MDLDLNSDDDGALFDVGLIEALLDAGFWSILHMVLLMLFVVTVYPFYLVAEKVEKLRGWWTSQRERRSAER